MLADLAPLVPSTPAPRRVAVIAKWGRTANAPLRNGWEGVTGYGPTVVQRVRSLLVATEDDAVRPPGPVTEDTNFPRPDPTSALWPLFSAPLVVADEPRDLPLIGPVRQEWERPTHAYRAPALPRVFWTGAWTRAPDDALAGLMLEAAGGDRAVLAPDAPALGVEPGAPEGPLAAIAVAVEGDRLEAEVTAPRAGLAVVLDPWFPGWSAAVDGRPAPLARADFAFMAVPVPEGRHTVRLEYRPTQLGRGIAVAIAAGVGLLAVLGWRRRAGAKEPCPHPGPLPVGPGEGDQPPTSKTRNVSSNSSSTTIATREGAGDQSPSYR
ncbi:MAG TPA: YfhO family protein [Anaeromyxobacteraceae bacterium]|nr:YfhO family protein [Anaeromyxobacteraceae bacterium]